MKIIYLIICIMFCSMVGSAINTAPTTPTKIVGPITGSIGSSYGYTTMAKDIDGNQIKYTFDWGDGTKSNTCLVGQGLTIRVFHKWNVDGIYNVKVMAIDSLGAISGWSVPLTVTIGGTTPPPAVNRAPANPSIPSGSASGISGTAYSYSTAATDPDGNKVKYTFSWGDGTSTTTGLVSSGASASTSHTWTVAAGTTKTFAVTAKATDEAGLISPISGARSVTISGPVLVNNPPKIPSIPSGDLTGKSGIIYTYSTKATDPDMDKVQFTFDWGDGTTSTTALVGSGVYVSASHSWSIAPGSIKTFNVAVKATDEHGLDSIFSYPCRVSIIAEKENHPPTIPSIPVGPTSLESGESGDFTTSSTDPDGDMLKYIFDWGDGSTQTDFFPSGQEVTASHSWNVPAGSTRSYKVRVICADTRYLTSRYPYWSSPLIISISGPSVMIQTLGLEAEEDGTVYVDTAVDMQTNASNSTDMLNESENASEVLI